MHVAIKILLGLISLLHFYFMWFEMFAWTTKGPKIFRNLPKDLFTQTKAMAANQGLYNGFLAAGLVFAIFIWEPHCQIYTAIFFLACIIIAGIYGAYSVDKKIFYIQALPALVTLILLHII